MKTLIIFLLLCSFNAKAQSSAAFPDKLSLKGSWGIAAHSSNDTDLVVMFGYDTALQNLIAQTDSSVRFRYPHNIGWNHTYNMYKGQFMTFENKSYVCGYVNDTAFKDLKGSFKGKFSAGNGKFEVSILVIKFQNELMVHESDTEYKAYMLGEYLVINRKISGVSTSWYFKRISNDILFREK